MKKRTWLLILLVVAQTVCYAKPERVEIKKADQHTKEKAAKGQIKNIDLRNIEDPEARKAIREIMNYLNLNTKG